MTTISPSGPDVLAEWELYLRAIKGRATTTSSAYASRLQRLAEAVGPRDLDSLDLPDLEGYIKRLYLRGKGASARAGVVAAIKSFYEWRVAAGSLSSSPAKALLRPQTYHKEAPYLTQAEVRTLLYGGLDRPARSAAHLRDRVLLVVMYWGGLRISEVGKLRAGDVVWQGRIASILIRQAKAARGDVRQYLDEESSRLLGIYLQTTVDYRAGSEFLFPAVHRGGVSVTTVRRAFLRRWQESGLKKGGRRVSPHILRHSLATHMAQAGAEPQDIQGVMRHSSLMVTGAYLHRRPGASRWTARNHPLRERPAARSALEELRLSLLPTL